MPGRVYNDQLMGTGKSVVSGGYGYDSQQNQESIRQKTAHLNKSCRDLMVLGLRFLKRHLRLGVCAKGTVEC